VNDQQNIYDFIYEILKSRDYVFKMSIFKKLSVVLYSVHRYILFIVKS